MMDLANTELFETSAKQNASRRKTLPAFIRKLWIIFMDSDDSNLAYWSNDGRVICIPNATQFSSNVLPRHFKHNNWPSFVRQLNLYGFRKVCETSIDSCRSRSDQEWQFKHDYFQRGAPHLLTNIERRVPGYNRAPMCEPLQSTEAQDIASANAPEADPDTASNSQWSSDSMQRIESMVRSLEHKSMELYNQVGQMRTMYMHQTQTLVDLIEKMEESFTSLETSIPTMSGSRNIPIAANNAILSSQSTTEDDHPTHQQCQGRCCDDQVVDAHTQEMPFLASKNSFPNRAHARDDLPPAFLTPDRRSIILVTGEQNNQHRRDHQLLSLNEPPPSSCV